MCKKKQDCLIYTHTHIHTHTRTHTHMHTHTNTHSLSLSLSLYHSSLTGGLQDTSCIDTELLYIGSSWLPGLCSSMWRGSPDYIAYEFVPTSPAIFRISGSSNLDSFRDGWSVAVQLLLCRVLSASKTCSILLVAFLCSCRQAFSPHVYLASM